MKLWRKFMKNIPTEENKELKKWRRRLELAKTAYSSQIEEMNKYKMLYEGTKQITNIHNTGYAGKSANNVRNIVYELIESQVDSSIPMPKVTAVHKEDADLARAVEHILVNYIKTLHLHRINDTQERTTPIMGGDFMQVEWDETKGYHTTLGDLSVKERKPIQVIPQPGVVDIEEMDYLFVLLPQTKSYVKRRYGVDVDDAMEEAPELREQGGNETDLVTVNIAYYRNKDGGIGTYTWCCDYFLEKLEDFQSRQLEVCAKCGKTKTSDTCECGSKKFEKVRRDYEDLVDSITVKSTMGDVLLNPEVESEYPMLDEDGNPVLDEMGMPRMEIRKEKKKIPFYNPKCYPIICRKNVTRDGYLVGYSDVAVIRDQQEAIKKYGSKILEESLKGGSMVTLPESVQVKTTDELMKVVRLKNQAEKALIDVINLAPSVSQDISMLEQNYQWAKSTLGITDAYQGKYDASATSGTAKQYSINQSAGRLESKRIMKNDAWAQLYELMFKYLLAYADQKLPVTYKGEDGKELYEEFDRYKFLRIDASGELYWNDEFIFDTDPTSTMMANREAMWNSIDVKYQAGAYGPIGNTETLLLLWKQLEANGYPNAGIILKDIETRYQQEKMLEGGVNDVVPDLQSGNEIIQPTP